MHNKIIIISSLLACSLLGMERKCQQRQPQAIIFDRLLQLPPELIENIAKLSSKTDAESVKKSCRSLCYILWYDNGIIHIPPIHGDHVPSEHNYWQQVRKYIRLILFFEKCHGGHNLIAVDAHATNIQKLPKRLKLIKNIVGLNLAGNKLEILPEGIEHLRQLKKLNVRNNLLSDGTILKLSKLQLLEKLDLSKNLLTTLPGEFSQFSHLRALDLSENNLAMTGLNPICSLPSLVRLNLSGSVKHGITPAIANLVMLQELNVSSNNLTPEQIELLCRLVNLRIFNAHNNRITYLPMAFSNLTHLRSLILSQNPITADGLGPVESLTNLKELDISSCPELHTFYDGIAQALQLERLNMQRTDIPLAHVQPLLARGTVVHD